MDPFTSITVASVGCLIHLLLCLCLLLLAVRRIRGRASGSDDRAEILPILILMVLTAGLISVPLNRVAGFPTLDELTDHYSYPRQLAWEHLGWSLIFCTPWLPLLAFVPSIRRRMNLVVLLTSIPLLSSAALPVSFMVALMKGE